MICLDPQNQTAQALHARLKDRIDPTALPEDICLVLGGDGFMLETIRTQGPERVFLGINAGRVGFLLNDPEDFEATVEAIEARAWTVHTFPRLAMTARPADGGDPVSALAVNDVYLERMSGQTAHLRITIDQVDVVDRLVCDGIIASTALGSTAYHFSASGHACHPGVRAIHLTPICPHSPRLTPLTLPAEARIAFDVISPDKRPVRAVADGVGYAHVERIEIQRSDMDVRLAFLNGHNFTATLVEKILSV
ncbi:MAG: NAD kinase [Myxococcota bacterium]|nr:NAD kinase [Myxococcota bacterium]